MRVIPIAALLMALGVCAGAFGAHALKEVLDDYSRGVYEKAVFYHFIHSIGLFVAGFLQTNGAVTAALTRFIVYMFLAGILLFSGSLYALALTGNKVFAAFTPIGGILFIFAWLSLAWASMRNQAS